MKADEKGIELKSDFSGMSQTMIFHDENRL